MISKPTVVVVGAGGSAPFGFPIGRKLLEEIVAKLSSENSPEQQRVIEYLVELEKNKNPQQKSVDIQRARKKDVLIFVREFDQSQLASIDAFLEKRREFNEIGRLAIASILVNYEDPKMFSRKPGTRKEPGQTWYEYLIDYLTRGDIKDFKKNKVSVVTFNYDRSMEYCLSKAVESTYELSASEALQTTLSVIPFVHVYGSLGGLSGEGARSYSNYYSHEVLETASSSIKVMDNTRTGSDEFNRAKDLLLGAKRIVFVGFGFDPVNLQRLQIESHSKDIQVYATAFGLEEKEIDSRIFLPLKKKMPNAQIYIDREGASASQALHKLMPFD